jgi:glyoxylase-like metal-dependent hydrolase (beta-lactamase superfamily II)
MVDIIPIISTSFDSNCYLILDEEKVIVDTGAGMDDRIAKKIRKRVSLGEVSLVINTHAHVDHCGGNAFFREAEVLAHRREAEEMVRGSLYDTCRLRGEKIPRRVDRILAEGDVIELGNLSLKVLHTPGHTPGSICLLEEEKRILFSGDTLFSGGGFGRVDLGGSSEEMIQSLRRLAAIDFDLLLPGHGGVAKNGKEQAKSALENALEFLNSKDKIY